MVRHGNTVALTKTQLSAELFKKKLKIQRIMLYRQLALCGRISLQIFMQSRQRKRPSL